MKKIVVVGGGTMGLDIAHTFARSGHAVVVREISDELAEKSHSRLVAALDKLVARGKMDEAKRAEILGNMTFTTDLAAAADADLVLEAIVENLDVKKSLFQELDGICKADTIFAQHLLHLHHRHRRRHPAGRPLHRDALLQSRYCDEAGGGHPGRPHLPGDL